MNIRYKYRWILFKYFEGKTFFLCKVCIKQHLTPRSENIFSKNIWRTINISKVKSFF